MEQSGCVDEESTGVRNAGLGWLVEKKYISPQTVDGMVITEPLNVEVGLPISHSYRYFTNIYRSRISA